MHGPRPRYLGLAAAAFAVALAAALAGRAAGGDPLDDAPAVLAAARAAVADGRVAPSKQLGFTLGKQTFNDAPPDGGVLIGFDLGVGKFLNIETIYALRAVYATPRGEDVQVEHGLFRDKLLPKNKTLKTSVLRTVRLRPRPGYAVGAVTLRTGLNINGLSVTFMRMKGDGLDPRQSYESDWVGDRTGGGEAVIGGDGAPVVGVLGSQDDQHVCALGLLFTTAPPPAAAPAAVAPPAVEAPAERPAPARVEKPVAPAVVRLPAEPPQAADDPAPAVPAAAPAPVKAAVAPVVAQANTPWLLVILPAAAFVAVVGLIAAFAFAAGSRKAAPPKITPPQVSRVGRKPAVAPSTAFYEIPDALPVGPPAAAEDREVLELGPDDFIDPPPAPAKRDDWPRLEI